MKNDDNNIIVIHNTCVGDANAAFRELMSLTEKEMNVRSVKNPAMFKKLTAFDLEDVSCKVIREVCALTPFRPDEIRLVSGHSFPDIIAEKYYGVEVKSTVKNHWTSTGSSIVESTRDRFVENIYMLFGNLGAEIPAFKCRPYQDVLYDIAVTHSPRYLIDMNLAEDANIFRKMGVEYDSFRKSGNQIECVREYFKEQARRNGVKEMPWWISSSDIEKASSFNIRMWNSISSEEKSLLMAKCLILFPKTMNPSPCSDKYTDAVLWLCSYCQVVSSCFRDDFSAGGQITTVDDKLLQKPVPRVLKTIVDCAPIIKNLLENPDAEMMELIEEYNSSLIPNPYEKWLEYCGKIGGDDLIRWIKNNSDLK
ncbi:MAG: hypothetical protein MJ009_01760 [Paludibacteraceae bacterium]|nr:hypothetical protein [Paludibacteraceae bacterium]